MKIKPILLSTLSTLALPNTSCLQTCPNGETGLELEGEVTATDLLNYIEYHEEDNLNLEDISCEELCVSIADDGWSYGHRIDFCELELTIDEMPSDETDDSVGTITCLGFIEVCMGGRRPMGHTPHHLTRAKKGDYFAACAHMEAASVIAFVQLAKQLRALGAPTHFVERCLEAAKDEVLHAKLLCRLAAAEGSKLPPLAPEEPTATLFSIALHNAVEGCVHENWAALMAHWQARHAPTTTLRHIYKRIAVDETKHGQLAWDLHEWFLQQLSPEERTVVQQAQRRAIQALVTNTGTIPADDLDVGLPTGELEIQLAKTFAEKLVA